MINQNVMKRVEEAYLKHFPEHFTKNEDFKWIAIKNFQRYWDIDATDFSAMLDLALGKTGSLLVSGYYYAKGVLLGFAQDDPEGLRNQFRILYDESRDLEERVSSFIAYAEDRKLNHNESGWKNTFQDMRAISVYLWLKYPDKYYIYKFGEVNPAAEALESSFIPKRSSDISNMIGAFKFCDEIHDHIVKNQQILDMFRSHLTDECYPDPEYRTLAFDVVFFISRFFLNDEWFPIDYNPGFSVNEWVDLLKNEDVFTKSSLAIMKRMKDIGGQATCTELAEKYGESKNYYSVGSTSLAKRIVTLTGCPVFQGNIENSRYWPILYVGKNASKENNGAYIWKLRKELSEALEKIDLSDVPLYVKSDDSLSVDDPDNLMKPGDEDVISNNIYEYEKYTPEDFLSEVFMDKNDYDKLVELLRRKKNVILQGAPGVGKTFTARRLAYSMMGMIDRSRVSMIQFHQNYSYEDFIMGYKPEGADFVLKTGVFYDFCEKARQDSNKEYFFIIDEINRGNLSKIFGELLQLIESDYRGEDTLLAYTHEPFSVPQNVYLIGMMNTADRSLALIDYALRRRFSFFQMNPGFMSDGFKEYQAGLNDEVFNAFVRQIVILNKEINEDPALGPGFQIGHSYLCLKKDEEYSEEWLHSVMEYDILPTLQEYWFDDKEKVSHWDTVLRSVFNE